jgi:glycosyltransferase involved in cell wall biosynthesis
LRALIVSGIWPPDVGGPASHAPELAEYLVRNGDSVRVVVTADTAPAEERYPVDWVPRRLPPGPRHAAVCAAIARRSLVSDVVYATSMLTRASLAAWSARRPIVVKLVADEAYERAIRRGLYEGSLDDFQTHRGGPGLIALRAVRDRALRRVDHLVCPSEYLARLAVTWGVPAARVTVLPNPAPSVPPLRGRDEIRYELGVQGAVVAFAGRLTAQKELEVGLAAVASIDDITLVVVGEGPERERLERLAGELGLASRVRFLGALDRTGVLEVFRAADLSILTSAWENFPHTVVEALAVGTPVVATAVGGVAEVVVPDVNGLLVSAGDHEAVAAAIRRVLTEPGLRARLSDAAPHSVEHLSAERVYARLRAVLLSV